MRNTSIFMYILSVSTLTKGTQIVLVIRSQSHILNTPVMETRTKTSQFHTPTHQFVWYPIIPYKPYSEAINPITCILNACKKHTIYSSVANTSSTLTIILLSNIFFFFIYLLGSRKFSWCQAFTMKAIPFIKFSLSSVLQQQYPFATSRNIVNIYCNSCSPMNIVILRSATYL